VKYSDQELPHSKDTDSPRRQEAKRGTERNFFSGFFFLIVWKKM
jgi:hypothetical protein